MIQRILFVIIFIFPVHTWAQAGPDVSDGQGSEMINSAVLVDSLDSPGWQAVELESLQLGSLETIPTPLRRSAGPHGWFFLLNCMLLLLLVVKFTVFQSFARKSWNAWINENLFFQFVREKAPVNSIIVAIESLLKIYVVSLVIMMVLELIVTEYRINHKDLVEISGYLLAFFIVKSILSLILAWLTDQSELFGVISLNSIIFSSNANYFLIPMILFVVYLAIPYKIYGVYAVVIIFGIAVILLIFRALRIFLKAHIPLNLQFFLYLCGLEILPYVFLAKFLETNFVN